MESDCRNCPDRTPFCHATCDSYKTYCANNEANKAAKKAYLDKNNAANEVLVSGYVRRKKRMKKCKGKREI